MVKKKDKKSLKNIAYLVSRNKTKQEILKVIFPNGLEVGLEDGQFHNGAKVNGNLQVTGIINADDVRIKGSSIGVFSFEPPSISLDASSAGRVSTFPATAFTKISPPTNSVSFGGHNTGRTPNNTSYEIVSADVTAICDNSSGTTLTASLSGASAEGDDSYIINLKNASSTTILQLTVSKAGGDAKLLATDIAINATGAELVTTIVVTIPIKTNTATVNKSFTVLKNIAGATGTTGKNAVSINISPSVIPVNTSVSGGAPNGLATASSQRTGVGASSGQAHDIYQNMIPPTVFSKASALESVTPLVYDGFVSGSFIFPGASKFFIQGHQITASLDTGTVVSASCTAFPANGTDDFGITGSIGSYPIFNLQFQDDSNDAKMSITFLSEHATSTTDFNHVKLDVPISVTTAAGDSQSNIIRSFYVQKAPQPEDPTDGTDGSDGTDAVSPPSFSISPSIIPIETSVTGGTPNGIDTSVVAGVGASSGQAKDIYQHDIPSTSFVMADGFIGSSQLTYDGFVSGSAFAGAVDKFRIQGHQITASLDTGTVVSASCTAFPSDGTLDFGITGSISNYPIFNLQVEDVGNDVKMSLSFLSEHATSTTDFNSVKIDVPFATRLNNNIVRSFTVQKQKRAADGTDGTDGSDSGGAIIQVKNSAAMNNIDGGSTTYSASSFNITNLATEVVNVGSDLAQADSVKTSNNTIDDSTGTNDSVRGSASTTYKFDITVVLTFGTSHADLVFNRGVTQARIGGNCYLVHATDVDQSSHGSTSLTYGTEASNPQPWQATYESAGFLPTSGAGITLSWSEVVTTSSSATFFWLRVDYAALTDFHDTSNADVALPTISIFSANMTATKIS